MNIRLVNIGFGNMVSVSRIIAILGPDAAPVRRVIADAKSKNGLIDATCGRRTRAVIIMDSQHVILSALQPETVSHRLDNKEEEE